MAPGTIWAFFRQLISPPFLLTCLPVILIIVSFVFSLLSITTPNWSFHVAFSNRIAEYPFGGYYEEIGVEEIGVVHRSPFFQCKLQNTTDGNGEIVWNEVCERANSPVAICSGEYLTGSENRRFCSQVVFAGWMLIVGCACIGLATVLSIGLFILSLRRGLWRRGYIKRRRPYRRPRHADADANANLGECLRQSVQIGSSYLALLLLLSTLVGALGVACAQVVGGNALVNVDLGWEVPEAVYSGPGMGVGYVVKGPAMFGVGGDYAVVAWVLAIFAAVIEPLVWEMPKVGVYFYDDEDNGHAAAAVEE